MSGRVRIIRHKCKQMSTSIHFSNYLPSSYCTGGGYMNNVTKYLMYPIVRKKEEEQNPSIIGIQRARKSHEPETAPTESQYHNKVRDECKSDVTFYSS